MSKRISKKLPQDIIDHWPEVFKDIELSVVPMKYLHSVRVLFNDGKIWDIDVAKSIKQDEDTNIEQSLLELFKEYADEIKHIDFRLDTVQIKKDIQARTNIFMKKKR